MVPMCHCSCRLMLFPRGYQLPLDLAEWSGYKVPQSPLISTDRHTGRAVLNLIRAGLESPAFINTAASVML